MIFKNKAQFSQSLVSVARVIIIFYSSLKILQSLLCLSSELQGVKTQSFSLMLLTEKATNGVVGNFPYMHHSNSSHHLEIFITFWLCLKKFTLQMKFNLSFLFFILEVCICHQGLTWIQHLAFFLQMKIRVLLLVYEYEARTMLNRAEKYLRFKIKYFVKFSRGKIVI